MAGKQLSGKPTRWFPARRLTGKGGLKDHLQRQPVSPATGSANDTMTLKIGRKSRSRQAIRNGDRPADRSTKCRLLVSVRNSDEALAALAGGCDVLDIKEPNHGSLGMADVASIASIVDSVSVQPDTHQTIEISAALGELADWLDVEEVPVLPAGLNYAKLGLSGATKLANWQHDFQRVQQLFARRCGQQLRWIAVIYADREPAGSPRPSEVIDAACEAHCSGILIDTFHKDGRTLWDWMQPNEVRHIAEQVHALEMTFAVAGSLRLDSLMSFMNCDVDLVAVRSAVCNGGDRRSKVSADLVRQFKNKLSERRS